MAERPLRNGLSLETWTVATVDVVALGLVAVLAGHVTGVLDDALPDVGTVVGILIFGYLWVLVVVAMRWVLADGGLTREEGRSLGRLLARGVAGAALVGMAFVAGIGLVIGLVTVGPEAGLVSAGVVTLFGAVAGAIGGSLLGFVFGLVDVGLARGADAVVDRLVD